MDITKRIESIVEQISKDLYEKDQSVKMVLLAVLAGESAFMLGEPGTAKSLVARRVAQAFANPTDAEQKQGVVKFFDYLMNRFSQPDEVFGPVSISKLKNDIYERKTEGYLPKAQFAFLDEIWKANPAIQNALLTILNERTFRNGITTERVPLVGFVAASNELPAPNQGLEAIFDRFLVRIFEKPVTDSDNFRSMISGKALPEVNVELPFDKNDLDTIRKAASEVKLSDECFNVIQNIRKQLTIKNEEKGREESERYVVSDRRWQKITNLMRVSAYCNGRKETDLIDASLIASCIWSTENQYHEATRIVHNAIVDNICNINRLSQEVNELINNLKTFKNDAFEEIPVEVEIDKKIYHLCKDYTNDLEVLIPIFDGYNQAGRVSYKIVKGDKYTDVNVDIYGRGGLLVRFDEQKMEYVNQTSTYKVLKEKRAKSAKLQEADNCFTAACVYDEKMAATIKHLSDSGKNIDEGEVYQQINIITELQARLREITNDIVGSILQDAQKNVDLNSQLSELANDIIRLCFSPKVFNIDGDPCYAIIEEDGGLSYVSIEAEYGKKRMAYRPITSQELEGIKAIKSTRTHSPRDFARDLPQYTKTGHKFINLRELHNKNLVMTISEQSIENEQGSYHVSNRLKFLYSCINKELYFIEKVVKKDFSKRLSERMEQYKINLDALLKRCNDLLENFNKIEPLFKRVSGNRANIDNVNINNIYKHIYSLQDSNEQNS